MDHHEQHHQHHDKARQERKRHEKLRESHNEDALQTIHPVWMVAFGTVLIFMVVLCWMVIAVY